MTLSPPGIYIILRQREEDANQMSNKVILVISAVLQITSKPNGAKQQLPYFARDFVGQEFGKCSAGLSIRTPIYGLQGSGSQPEVILPPRGHYCLLQRGALASGARGQRCC